MTSNSSRHPMVYRILHRLIMFSILLLIITGFYIHYPFVDNGWGFMMATMRGVHFFCAGVLTLSVILRVILMFVGRNRDWASFLPTLKDYILLPKVLCHYAHLCDMPNVSKKYNPLQMMSYTAVFLLAIFQILSGFAMMYPDGWLSWFNYGIFGTEVNTRIAHYIINWVFIIFVMIHLYLGIRDAFDEMKEMHMVPDDED